MHHDSLLPKQYLIAANGKFRRSRKLQLAVNDLGLQFNRLLRPLAFDFGQHLKEGWRCNLLSASCRRF